MGTLKYISQLLLPVALMLQSNAQSAQLPILHFENIDALPEPSAEPTA